MAVTLALSGCSSGADEGAADQVAEPGAGGMTTTSAESASGESAPQVNTDLAGGFEAPRIGVDLLGANLTSKKNLVDLAFREPDGKAFVLDRRGKVYVLGDGGLSSPVLDLTSEVTPELAWGLLGMAFAPDGLHAYVNETDGFETRIHEFPVAGDGTFDLGRRRVVYRFDQPADAHNGGDLLFGPDGLLYIFNGDGGGDRDEEGGEAWNSDINRQALSLGSPLGKILRIDPRPSGGAEFTVPGDNPFVGEPDSLAEIWSVGVRNPWRNSFDPATGDLWVADVGNFSWEEISRAEAEPNGTAAGRGVSFGWSAWEGTSRMNEDQPAEGHLAPLYEYPHGELMGCSIVGGPVYRGQAVPEIAGRYLFGDFCSGAVWAMDVDDAGSVRDVTQIASLRYLVDITVGPDENVYLTSITKGVHVLRTDDDGEVAELDR